MVELKSMSAVYTNSSQPSLAHPKRHLQPIRVSWSGRLFGERLFGHFAVLPAQMAWVSTMWHFLCALLFICQR